MSASVGPSPISGFLQVQCTECGPVGDGYLFVRHRGREVAQYRANKHNIEVHGAPRPRDGEVVEILISQWCWLVVCSVCRTRQHCDTPQEAAGSAEIHRLAHAEVHGPCDAGAQQ